eukprot:6206344-Pleurochrysis_carterae.AAC.1
MLAHARVCNVCSQPDADALPRDARRRHRARLLVAEHVRAAHAPRACARAEHRVGLGAHASCATCATTLDAQAHSQTSSRKSSYAALRAHTSTHARMRTFANADVHAHVPSTHMHARMRAHARALARQRTQICARRECRSLAAARRARACAGRSRAQEPACACSSPAHTHCT